MYHERQHRQHCLKHALNNLLQREAFSIGDLNKLADSIHAQRTLFFGNYDVNVLALALDSVGLELRWHDPRDTQLAQLRLEQPCPQQRQQQQQQQQQSQPHAIQALEQACLQQPQHQQAQPGHARHNCEAQRQAQEATPHHHPTNQQQDEQMKNRELKKEQQQQLQEQGEPQQYPQQYMQPDSRQASSNDAQQLCSSAASHSSCGQQQQLVGLVLNVRGDGLWASLMGGRHWLTIKCIHGVWWNLDSRLAAPCSFVGEPADVADGGACSLRRHLQQQLEDGAHIMLVYIEAAR